MPEGEQRAWNTVQYRAAASRNLPVFFVPTSACMTAFNITPTFFFLNHKHPQRVCGILWREETEEWNTGELILQYRLGQYDSFSGLQRDLRGLHLFVKDLLVFTVPLLLLLLLALPVGLVPVQLVLRLGVQLLWQERLQGKAETKRIWRWCNQTVCVPFLSINLDLHIIHWFMPEKVLRYSSIRDNYAILLCV